MKHVIDLRTTDSGIVGVISVPTVAMSPLPIIKWFPLEIGKVPHLTAPIVIPSNTVNHGLPYDVFFDISPTITGWVERNKDPLINFWTNSKLWDDNDIANFIASLKK